MDLRTPAVIGAAAGGALLYHERHARQAVERFAAAALETLLNAIEANDQVTGMHVRRVAAYSLIIADAAGFDERRRKAIERVALFHDIGKIHEALFDIVHEHSRLSPEERRAIATHPRRGAEVLEPLEAFYPELTKGVLSHHERWDGGGYPRGLKGRAIPLEARVVTIADTFDAVTHSRRYRGGRGIQRALDVLAGGRGTQFDPELVDLTLLPPVVEEMARVHVTTSESKNGRPGRRANRKEQIPDVSFRWRTDSLRSRRVSTPRRVD
jgi:HD-GYP domain-containing protein (c-di-GMP phosphodiesterase class II)